MLVNPESLSLAWYLPQPGTNSWGTFVYCTFPCSTILIDVLILGPSLLPDGQMVNSSQEILLADKQPVSHGNTAKLSQNICTLTCHLLQNINSLFCTFILASRLNCFIFNFLLTQLTDYKHARSSSRQCTVMTDIKWGLKGSLDNISQPTGFLTSMLLWAFAGLWHFELLDVDFRWGGS